MRTGSEFLFSIIAVLILCSNGIDQEERLDMGSNARECDVGIIGGGISGLYTAYELLKHRKETKVCVFEKDKRLGGRIHDHLFKEAPNIDVGLGAWRIDEMHPVMRGLLKELGIKSTEWTFTKPNLHEAREIRSANESVIKNAYVALKADPRFGHMSAGDLWDYALKPEHTATADKFATPRTYFNHYITPEGTNFIGELSGYNGDFSEFISTTGYIEFLKVSEEFTSLYIRPVGGMSTIIDKLEQKVLGHGGKIFRNTAVTSLAKKGRSKYSIGVQNSPYQVKKYPVKKLVIAVTPLQLGRIAGSVARKIRKIPQFQSVQPVPAFKGGAVYKDPWWEAIKVAGESVLEGQRFISVSNCLGFTMPYRGRGTNGEAVLHTMYTDGACANHWGEIASLKRSILEDEVHRALEWKFRTKIPRPIDTAYQYWKAGWHFQKPGTKYTMADVEKWAKRPLPRDQVFLAGEAFHPIRGWCEGAILSARNALKAGWGLGFTKKSDEMEMKRRRPWLVKRVISRPVERA